MENFVFKVAFIVVFILAWLGNSFDTGVRDQTTLSLRERIEELEKLVKLQGAGLDKVRSNVDDRGKMLDREFAKIAQTFGFLVEDYHDDFGEQKTTDIAHRELYWRGRMRFLMDLDHVKEAAKSKREIPNERRKAAGWRTLELNGPFNDKVSYEE